MRRLTRDETQPPGRRLSGGGRARRGALGTGAIGSAAVGALALGAIALGAVAIGRLAVRRARIRSLVIDELVVRRLRVLDPEWPALPAGDAAAARLPDGRTEEDPKAGRGEAASLF